MALVDCTVHLFAGPFQKLQSPTPTTTTPAAVPVLTSQSPSVERNNTTTHENFQTTQNSPSLLTLILGIFIPIILTSTIAIWYALENIMSGKDKAENKKKKKSHGGAIQATVEYDIIPPSRDEHTCGRNNRSANESKPDKVPENSNRCSETGKLKPSIPIPHPFPIPWLPIFIPPLDAADDAAADQGSTDPASNRSRPSAAILSLLGKTRHFIPQLDEQVVGPKAARQSLSDWELALRASGVGGPALPRSCRPA